MSGINEQFFGVLAPPAGPGTVIQVVNVSNSAVATTTTDIPADDTIPQNDEGAEVMTLEITPASITNLLKIEVTVMMAMSVTAGSTHVALFQDSTAGALSAAIGNSAVANNIMTISFVHFMTAGTESATTFKVRVGANTGTFTFNGSAGTQRFGGVAASSITITEIQG